MRRVNSPWRPVEAAALHWNDEGNPLSTRFDDIYYSRDNGLEESRYVFLQGNRLPERWRNHPRRHFCIAETGFGTGLNFLLTWQAWRALPEPRPDLHYLSIEKFPLTPQDLARALELWPELSPLTQALLDSYPGLLPGQHRLPLDQGRVTLDLWWEDVGDALPDLASRGRPAVDAWYLDGFAPSRNEAMWSAEILRCVAALSHQGGTFATFTAAGRVRRDLSDAGFEVSRAPGYGRKRECLRGELGPEQNRHTSTADTPWDIAAGKPPAPDSALIIGGGLAGCTVAAALARRGIRVTLLEKDTLANAGSGNDQGILYTRLSRKHSSITDFALQSFRFASIYYRELFASGLLSRETDGNLCGSFHPCDDDAELSALAEALTGVPELARVMSAGQARQVLGIDQPRGGYWYPTSGWLRPASVCHALANNSNIRVMEQCGDLQLEHAGGQWHALSDTKTIATASCAVVAAGTAAAGIKQFDWLPLQAIRGQTTQLPTAAAFSELRAALCHEGYIAPSREGSHCIGATFHVDDPEGDLRLTDHCSNLAKLGDAVPDWRSALATIDPTTLGGRVGYRCASPDYLPMTGPAPDVPAFLQAYGPLRRNARQKLSVKAPCLPGLYLSTAHGSRGLTSAPLAAELLASMICGEPLPLNRELCRAVAPARFIIRNLIRNKI